MKLHAAFPYFLLVIAGLFLSSVSAIDFSDHSFVVLPARSSPVLASLPVREQQAPVSFMSRDSFFESYSEERIIALSALMILSLAFLAVMYTRQRADHRYRVQIRRAVST